MKTTRQQVLLTYSLQVLGPSSDAPAWDGSFKLRETFIRETEENLTDLLPDGYKVVIREWDSEEV